MIHRAERGDDVRRLATAGCSKLGANGVQIRSGLIEQLLSELDTLILCALNLVELPLQIDDLFFKEAFGAFPAVHGVAFAPGGPERIAVVVLHFSAGSIHREGRCASKHGQRAFSNEFTIWTSFIIEDALAIQNPTE